MQELVKITESNGKKAVSARELHSFLESKQDFSNWMKNRITKYGLIENEDYARFDKIIETTGGRSIEYALSLDSAKELSMVEGNSKGKEARKYFIECEKQLKETFSIPQSFSEALILAAKQQEEIEANRLMLNTASKIISTLQPKADLMDKVLDCGEKIDIGQTAKILKLPYGRNTLFSELRKIGIFFKERNEPKQEYIKKGYFEIYEKMIPRNSHETFMVVKVLVTQKGLAFIDKMLNGDKSDKILAQIR